MGKMIKKLNRGSVNFGLTINSENTNIIFNLSALDEAENGS